MLFHAKNGAVCVGDMNMDYVSFGRGEDVVVMLPGLGDGLRTVRGMALPLAMLYRIYAKDHSVFIFSRRNDLPEGHSTRDMAEDQARAMEVLGITDADVIGISQKRVQASVSF